MNKPYPTEIIDISIDYYCTINDIYDYINSYA